MIADLKPYTEYKKSGVLWLGCIPSHWDIGPGFGVFREKNVKNKGMQETTVLSLSYGQIVVKPLEKLHGLVPDSFETYQIVEPGDIIIRSTDLQNDWNSLRVGLVRNRGIITSAYLCFRTTHRVYPEYGYQVLHTFDKMKVFYGLGSGLRQNLSFGDFKHLTIFVPPYEEQKSIVRYIDYANTQLEGAIQAKRKLIVLLKEQKNAIIGRAVTCGLDSSAPMKSSGIPWLERIPQHWEILALKRVLLRLIDCEHKTAPQVDQSEYRVVRTTGIRHGVLRNYGTYCTTPTAFRIWTRRGTPEPGDVIFTREAPAGEACIVPENMNLCLGQRTVLMKLDAKRINSQFLIYMIYSGPPRISIALSSQGSTVGHFNMSDIGSLSILLPPKKEQDEIVEALRKQTQGLDFAISRLDREIMLLQEYRTRLIADIVTGKLDVREVLTKPPQGAFLDKYVEATDSVTEVKSMDEDIAE